MMDGALIAKNGEPPLTLILYPQFNLRCFYYGYLIAFSDEVDQSIIT